MTEPADSHTSSSSSSSSVDLEATVERLKDALHADKTGLAAAIAEMVRLAKARAWILDGRGPYEWDDDEYRKEAGYALSEIIEYGRKALNDSGNLAHGEDGCRRRRWVPISEVEQLRAQLAAQSAAIEVARQQVAHCEVCRVNIREALARGQHRGERVMGRGSWAMVIKSWSCRLENHSNCDGQVVLERDERVNLHVVNCGCDCHQPAANTTREEQG